MIILRAQILHKGHLFGRGRITPEQLAWMIAHPPGPSWEILLSPEGGLADVPLGWPSVAARMLCAGRLLGEFALSPEDIAHVAEHPDAGQFLVTATPDLVAALVEAEQKEAAAPPAAPAAPPAAPAPIVPEVSALATATVFEPLVV